MASCPSALAGRLEGRRSSVADDVKTLSGYPDIQCGNVSSSSLAFVLPRTSSRANSWSTRRSAAICSRMASKSACIVSITTAAISSRCSPVRAAPARARIQRIACGKRCFSSARLSEHKAAQRCELGPTELPLGAVCAVDDLAVRHRNGRGLYLGDQPSKRNRYNCAQYRKSNPDSKGLAPHRITDTQELWVAPLNHNGSIGNFLVKLYIGPELTLSALRDEGSLLGPHRRSLRARAVTRVGSVFDRLTIDPHHRVLADYGSYANLTDRHGKRFAGATSLDANRRPGASRETDPVRIVWSYESTEACSMENQSARRRESDGTCRRPIRHQVFAVKPECLGVRCDVCTGSTLEGSAVPK